MNPTNDFFEKTLQCIICGESRLTPAFQVNYWKENRLSYSDCQDCGATFANPMPTSDLISQGNSALVRFLQNQRSLEEEFHGARQAYLRGKLMGYRLSRWKRKGRLLELGCYQGFFALGVKENSEWEVEGLEISNELCTFVQNTLGIHCYNGTLEETPLPPNHFDFVVCHDLIEHINQPQRFLHNLSSILRLDGRVQVITPNSKQDLAYTRRAHHAGITVTMLLNHILYFTPRTLRFALERVGLAPLKLYCYDIRHVLKDFGLFGLGKPTSNCAAPSMEDALKLEEKRTLSLWTPENLVRLRHHRKTSRGYGMVKEVIPKALTLHVPENFEIGHEIYALAAKRPMSSA